MSAALNKFLDECGYPRHYWDSPLLELPERIPCYGLRITVRNEVNTEDRIKKLIKYGAMEAEGGETMFFFSITKQDQCWDAWDKFAKDHPKTFAAVVETKSRHRPTYPVRLYIYVKKPRTRKVKS